MGESFSDLTAVEFLHEYGLSPADDEDPFAVGAYVTGSNEKGIRNYNMSDSPLNYSNVQGYDGSGNGSPHDDGEIWSAVNFDIRAGADRQVRRRRPPPSSSPAPRARRRSRSAPATAAGCSSSSTPTC